MENDNKKIMSIVQEDGSIDEVEVVIAFEFKDTKKEYVVYTKNEKDAMVMLLFMYHVLKEMVKLHNYME